MRIRWILPLIAEGALAAVGGCAPPPPYVYRHQEFDREQKYFGKELPDISSVGICYNKKNATPRQIVEMAQAECAKYDRVARLIEQRRLECPVVTPMEAVFTCEPRAGNDPFPSNRY